MIIEQTVEIPADHRLIIEVPHEIPAGRTVLTFTPIADRKPPSRESCLTEEEDAVELAFEALDAFEEDLKRAAPQELAIMRDTVVTFNMAEVTVRRPSKESPGA